MIKRKRPKVLEREDFQNLLDIIIIIEIIIILLIKKKQG